MRTYADLLALAESCPVFSSVARELAPVAGGSINTTPVGEGGSGEDMAAAAVGPAGSGKLSTDTTAADTVYERQICDAIQLGVLGKVGNFGVKVFSTFHRRSAVIPDISRLTYEGLLVIAGAPVKAHVLKSSKDGNVNGMFSIDDVRDAIALLAGYRAINEETELGLGCWEGGPDETEKSVVLVGRNEGAVWNGGTLTKLTYPECQGMILDFESTAKARTKGWYEFDPLAEYVSQAKSPEWRASVRNDLISLFGKWRWHDDAASPVIVAGLVFSTWVQSLWEWRPQVSITGPTKAGKSTLGVGLSRLFGSLCKKSSDSTEAGIRQTIQSSSKIILCDEFDAEDREKAKEQKKILKMIRSAGSGDSIMRGDAGQKGPKEYSLKHIIWLAGIQVSSTKAADRNRYINLELLPPHDHMRNKLVLPSASELKILGQKSLAVAIHCIHDARRLAVTLKDTRLEGVDDRIIESYSVPAAMLAVIDGDTSDGAREILKDMLKGIAESEQTGDEERLMGDILGGLIQMGPDRFSVGQLLDIVIREGNRHAECAVALESRGLKIDKFGTGKDTPDGLSGKPCFVMAYHLIASHLLKGTSWEGQGIDQILRRLPNKIYSRRRVGGQAAYVVSIPLSDLRENYLGDSDDGHQAASINGQPDESGGKEF